MLSKALRPAASPCSQHRQCAPFAFCHLPCYSLRPHTPGCLWVRELQIEPWYEVEKVPVAQARAAEKMWIGAGSQLPGPGWKQAAGGWLLCSSVAEPSGLARGRPADSACSRGVLEARPLVGPAGIVAGAEPGYLAGAGASGRVHNSHRTRRDRD